MKKVAILLSLPLLVLSFSNFKSTPKESRPTEITIGGAMLRLQENEMEKSQKQKP